MSSIEDQVYELFFEDGLQEREIARIMQLPELEIHEILAGWEDKLADMEEI